MTALLCYVQYMEDLAKMGEEERRIGLGEDTMTEGEEEEMRTKFLKRRESRWVRAECTHTN